MKTEKQIRIEEHLSTARSHRLTMRAHAMSFRRAVCPDARRTLVQRGEDGLHALKLAIGYRVHSNDYLRMAANL